MTYRIFIVEDHPRMRETYGLLLATAPDLTICGLAATAAEALAEIPRQNADLIVVDLSLPDGDGFDLTRQLRQQYPVLPILIVSGHEAEGFASQASEAGASGYVDKYSAHVTLLPTIRTLLGMSSY